MVDISITCGSPLVRRQPQPMSMATGIGYFHITVFYNVVWLYY